MLLGRLRGSVSCQVLFSTPPDSLWAKYRERKSWLFRKRGQISYVNGPCRLSGDCPVENRCGKPCGECGKVSVFHTLNSFFHNNACPFFCGKMPFLPLPFPLFRGKKTGCSFVYPIPFQKKNLDGSGRCRRNLSLSFPCGK